MDARLPVSISGLSTPKLYWDVLLVCAFLVGSLTSIWFPDQWEPKCLFGLTLVGMALARWSNSISVSSRDHARPGRPWVRMTLLTLAAVVIMYLGCRGVGAFHGLKIVEMSDKSWSHWISVKLPTVVGQQIMLQLLLAPILLRLFKNLKIAACVGALIFALLHFPNPVLVALTFIAGLFWITAYFRTRKLAPIIVSHFVLAVLAAGFCGEYIFNMRIGPSCFELFPQKIATAGDVKYEFPGCMVGCAERFVQTGDQWIIEGWAVDPIHNTSPSALYWIVDGRLVEIRDVEFERVPASQWERASQSSFVRSTCYSFVARIPASQVRSLKPIRLLAANANGHLGRVGQMGEFVSMDGISTNRPIVVFPVEVDGRVNQVVRRPDGLHLRGWAADLRKPWLPETICLKFDGQLRTIDLRPNRHSRPDIATVLDEPGFEQAGFDIDLGPISVFYLKNMKCFVVDENQQLHPIQLTEHAETSVARLMDGINDNTIWR